MPSMQLFEYWWEDRWAFGKLPAHTTAATKMAAVISASPTTTMHHPQGHRLNGPKGRALWAPWTPWVWGPMGSHGPPRGFKGFPGVVVVGVAPMSDLDRSMQQSTWSKKPLYYTHHKMPGHDQCNHPLRASPSPGIPWPRALRAWYHGKGVPGPHRHPGRSKGPEGP